MGANGGVSLGPRSPFDVAGVIPEQSSAYIRGRANDCSDLDDGLCALPMPLGGWMGGGEDYSDVIELLAGVLRPWIDCSPGEPFGDCAGGGGK